MLLNEIYEKLDKEYVRCYFIKSKNLEEQIENSCKIRVYSECAEKIKEIIDRYNSKNEINIKMEIENLRTNLMEKGNKYASMKVSQAYDQVMFEKTGAIYQECAKMLEGVEI
ncbi:hypothetical protein D2962_08300 [Biomaibacter acetigenes]|uniref:Uncharacterized protein n=1 Tax=Biomaibacter acetigenes TaxID=2316383 RepID=A0A3G2R519_9FIRM|nr:hypothetical protein [Biomaibacter acetigenes]AYO30624.1 hypothetical protein D2962_08300 [Biomaibacter acetigenes]